MLCEGAVATSPSRAETSVELTVIIPTYNERGNILPLLAALEKALRGLNWEVFFVDDHSPDGTADCIREMAAHNPRVRILERIGQRGLSSACIAGMLASETPYVAVMDADLQHDETVLPRMLEAIKTEDLDIVIASRTIHRGDMGQLSKGRVCLSEIGSRISRLACHCTVSDAMSGFFVVRRGCLKQVLHRLHGTGFKLLVDLLACSSPSARIREIPYQFRSRQWGKSKFSLGIALQYLGSLACHMARQTIRRKRCTRRLELLL
jgi:dolichol-phosphate mannosyltransferase